MSVSFNKHQSHFLESFIQINLHLFLVDECHAERSREIEAVCMISFQVMYVIGSSRKPKLDPGLWRRKQTYAWNLVKDHVLTPGTDANIHLQPHLPGVCQEIGVTEDLDIPNNRVSLLAGMEFTVFTTLLLKVET